MKNLILIFILVVFTCCNRHRNHPGWDYFPDMFYSTAYETYTDNPNFTDSMTMRVPSAGAVPRGHVPFEYTVSTPSRTAAGNELVNPFSPTPENIEKGRSEYTIFCVGCHGPSGTGDGQLFTMGLYPLKPRPISGDKAAVLKDGEIYHTITLGFGSMGPHGSQVRPENRWKIVLYIREMQRSGAENQGGLQKDSI